MSLDEIVALTRAMASAGSTLSWAQGLVVDKHCIGGLPGNRTTPIVVAIAAAAGLTMPKTSSRAITSPAGTADAMETLAPVALDLAAMRRVVEKEGGCVVWGGAMDLSPADDMLIRVERALRLAGEVLKLGGTAQGDGVAEAARYLDGGQAWKKFQAICEAQGGMRTPQVAPFQKDFTAHSAARVKAIDNRKLARVAKLAGAPASLAAGLEIRARTGDRVERGQPLFTLHAQTRGEMAYAAAYAEGDGAPFQLEPV